MLNRNHKTSLFFSILLITLFFSGISAIPVKAITIYDVTIVGSVGGYISVTGGVYNDYSMIGVLHFASGTFVTFTAHANTGNRFLSLNVTEGTLNGGTTQNPLTLQVLGDFHMGAYFEPLPSDYYRLTVGQTGTGAGTVNWGTITNQVNGEGEFNVSGNDNLIFTAIPNSTSIFNFWNFWDEYGHSYSFAQNPLHGYLSRNMSVNAVFSTDSITLTPVYSETGTTQFNWVFNQSQIYEIYGSITSGGSIPTDGTYLLFSTQLKTSVTDLGVPANEFGNEYFLLSSGTFHDGYFTLSLQTYNYTYDVYQGLQVAVLYNTTAQQSIDLISNIMDILNPPFTQALFPDSTSNLLSSYVNSSQFFFTPVYTVKWLSSLTPTTTPPQQAGTYLGIAGEQIALIIYAICIIGMILAFYYLHNPNIPFAFCIGLIIATIISTFLGLLGIYTYPIIALTIVAIIGILIFMRH